jgi:hypothetical protein
MTCLRLRPQGLEARLRNEINLVNGIHKTRREARLTTRQVSNLVAQHDSRVQRRNGEATQSDNIELSSTLLMICGCQTGHALNGVWMLLTQHVRP